MLALARLMLVFAVVGVLLAKKLHAGAAMFLGSILLGAVFGLGPAEILRGIGESATSASTLTLVGALLFIRLIGAVMGRTGLLTRMTSSLAALVRDCRTAMALLPALMAFLVSPGGAIFSAPMVDEVSSGLAVTPQRKSFVNYWFRHVLEYVCPLFTSLILCAEVAQVPLANLIATLAPVAACAAVIGAVWSFRGVGKAARRPDPPGRGLAAELCAGAWPIAAIFVMTLVLRWPVWLSTGLVLALLVVVARPSRAQLEAAGREALRVQVLLLVGGVVAFKDMIALTGAVAGLPQALTSTSAWSGLLAFGPPFILGLATGYLPAPIGLALPVVFGTVRGPEALRLAAFVYVSSFAGVMLSPVHLCLVLTADYFRVELGKVLRLVVAPEMAVVAFAAWFYLFR